MNISQNDAQNGEGPPLALYEKLVSTLVEEFEKQYEVYQEIISLAQQLQECLDGDDPEKIVELVSTKQAKVNLLTQIEAEMAPYKEVWAKVREQVPESFKEELKEKVDAVGETLQTLLALEHENEKKLCSLTRSKQEEIKVAQQEKRAFSAYNLKKPVDPTKYLDKKG